MPENTNENSPTPKRIRRVALSAAILIVTTVSLTATSLALFTDTETVGGNGFTTGTIDLTASPATAVVTMPAMAPGDQVTAPLTVTNTGTLALRYAMTSQTTEDALAAELVFTVKSGVTACDDADWGTDGTTLYSGALGSSGDSVIFGDVTPGDDAGDRTLAAAATEDLCLNVTLPLVATAGQGMTTAATFTLHAEQTKNNA